MMNRKTLELEDVWESMEAGIEKVKKILEGKSQNSFTAEEYIHLYTTVYNLCTQKPKRQEERGFRESQLYGKYGDTLDGDISTSVLPVLRERHGEFLLGELVLRWSNHQVMVRWLSRFLQYLERYYIPRRWIATLKDLGHARFMELVYREFQPKARASVLDLIEREREGYQVDRGLLKNALDFFVEKGMEDYVKDFEAAMLVDTAGFYSRKASRWILEDSCPEYMLKAEESLNREKERVSHYLHSSTEPKLMESAQHELLTKQAARLLENEQSGIHVLLRDDKVDDLARMYRLFSRIPSGGLGPVAEAFKRHITAEGLALVNQAEDAASNKKDGVGSVDQAYVRMLIELHDKFMPFVTNKCFGNDSRFHKALKEAFETFCNKNVAGCSSAELLSSFTDNVLRKGGSEKLSDEAIEESLEKVVVLLTYITDKDLFAEFSRKKLARRLLFGQSDKDEHERSFLSKLKQKCGGQFTSKMEGMVTDMEVARSNQLEFENHLRDHPRLNPGISMNVSVLTTGYWPTYKASDLLLPKELVKCVDTFKQFYESTTKSKKLTWTYSLGSCHVNGKFSARPTELIVTTYQAALLLLFNESERLRFEEIKDQLNLPEEDVVRLLHSVSCGKYKILNKEPNTKTVSKTDLFEFNSKFTDKMRRIKVPLAPLEEKKKIIEEVDKDRRYAVDAAVVRIMKSRKVLNYQHLVSETVEMLNRMFKPDVKLIKKRIEDLITRDYLERDKDNPNLFKYLA